MTLSLIISLITWPPLILLSVILYLLGLILVPIALYFDAYDFRMTAFGLKRLFTWPIMTLWNNLEDGLYPLEYLYRNQTWSFFKLAFMWCCIRNPSSGLRWAPILSFIIDPKKIRYIGTLKDPKKYEEKIPSFVYIWHGPYACFWWHFKIGGLYRVYLGHKMYASDSISNTFGYREFGTGFSGQFKRVQLGDNKN